MYHKENLYIRYLNIRSKIKSYIYIKRIKLRQICFRHDSTDRDWTRLVQSLTSQVESQADFAKRDKKNFVSK